MTIYFHAATCGFYDTRVHGDRMMLIPDPDWRPPMIDVPDPNWVNLDGASTRTEPPIVQVRDPKAIHPTVKVPNPHCYLPPASTLLEITQKDYQALFAAQTLGKVIVAEKGRPVAIDPPPLSWEQLRAEYIAGIQLFLDKSAQEAGYGDIKDAISYADEPAVPKFQADALAFRAWRSLSWAYSNEQLAAIEAGKRDAPTITELVAELPNLVLSDV